MKLPLRARIEIAARRAWDILSTKGASGFQRGEPVISTGAKGSTSQMLTAYSSLPWLRASFGKVADGIGSAVWYVEAASSNKKYIKLPTWANANGEGRKSIRKKLTKVNTKSPIEVNEIFDHIILETLANPNPFMTGPALMSLTALHIDLTGEAVWWVKTKDVAGERVPTEYWPIPPSWISERPKSTSDTFKVNADGFPKEIPISNVIWFRDPDPANPYLNTVGPAGALRDELESDEYASKHIKAWFLNKARPDIVVSGTGISDEEIERAEEIWLSKFRGYYKAHRPHFFRKDVKIQEIGSSFQDMQLVELRKWQRDIVLQSIGLPPEILGVLESSNRATIDTAAFIFARWVLTPRLELIRATLQTQLVPMYDDRIVIDYESPIEEDREFKKELMKIAPWAWVIDEWRALAGDAPLANGQGQIVMIPATYVPTKVSEIDQFVSPYTAENGKEIEKLHAQLMKDLEKAGLQPAA